VTVPLQSTAPVLVCDLDGTLIDSVPDLADSLSALLAGLGRRPLSEAEVQPMIGDGVPALVARALDATGEMPPPDTLAALIAHYVAIYETRMTARTRPYPGALHALAGLRRNGWRLAVCSNKPEHASREILAALGFGELIEAVAGGDSFPVKKPDPGQILRLLQAMGAAPSSAVMLGDSNNDIAAARAAGLPVVAVAHGYGAVPAQELGADRVIAHFDELAGALDALVPHLARKS